MKTPNARLSGMNLPNLNLARAMYAQGYPTELVLSTFRLSFPTSKRPSIAISAVFDAMPCFPRRLEASTPSRS